jgi:predicted KAP-like P-loop ATPase
VTDQDFLGYSSYVNVLAETCTLKDLAPLTLGIFGPWGSGKTSLMRVLQAKIDLAGAGGKVKTLWFNAWRYEGREEARSGLIHAVLKKVIEGKTLGQEVKERLGKLKTGAGTPSVRATSAAERPWSNSSTARARRRRRASKVCLS